MKEIKLTRGCVAFVDNKDYLELNKYNWFAQLGGRTPYAVRASTRLEKKAGFGNAIRMHRQILGLGYKDKSCVDHINHNGLDNRRKNIRICTYSQNGMNRLKQQKTATSKFKGTTLTKSGKWQSSIVINKKPFYLGRYDTELEAANAYAIKAKELFGNFNYMQHCKDEQ